jgi:hypothetical protein
MRRRTQCGQNAKCRPHMRRRIHSYEEEDTVRTECQVQTSYEEEDTLI